MTNRQAQVSILLATYKPNMTYFEKLLISLNEQTYPNLTLIVRDDSDDEFWFKKISNLITSTISEFEFTLTRNLQNMGSNRTFEQLTLESPSRYSCYCDQDDIWEKEKIERLVEKIEEEQAVLVYSDLSIIDQDDNQTAASFTDINKRVVHRFGEGLFPVLLRRNSVTGCTMLMRTDIAQAAIPFAHEFYVHDHWLTLYASTQGKIAYVKQALVRYRIHDGNQIGATLLSGITTKKDYVTIRIQSEKRKYVFLLTRFTTLEQAVEITLQLEWTKARLNYFAHPSIKNGRQLLAGYKFDKQLTLFELALGIAPEFLAKQLISVIRK